MSILDISLAVGTLTAFGIGISFLWSITSSGKQKFTKLDEAYVRALEEIFAGEKLDVN